MNIVIAGAGAVGTHLAKMLSRQEHNIMLIDTNQCGYYHILPCGYCPT